MATTSPTRAPRQARAVRTRAAILTAAQMEFSVRGYAQTTSKSIADKAGVSVGTFYQYFTDKAELLRELAQSRAVRISENTLGQVMTTVGAAADTVALRAMMPTLLRQLVGYVVDAHRDDPGFHAVLTERRHVDAVLDALISESEQALVQEISRLLRLLDQPGDPVANAFILFCMVEGAVHTHVLGDAMVSDEQFVEALVTALLRVAIQD